jgi:hypothetical protein
LNGGSAILVEGGLSRSTGQALDLANQIAGENLVEARRSMAVLTSAQP